MDMDKAPLNRAHQLERRAQVLNHQKKYDECIECHKQAVQLYEECLKIGENKLVRESVQLQKEWNERQIRTIQLKKAYLDRLENEKKLSGISSRSSQKDSVQKLEAKIFRTMETHDSLICYLGQRGLIDNEYEKQCHSPIAEEENPAIVGNKHPKDDSTVIEELKELSGQLRESVQGLLIQLDDRNKEIEQLRSHIKELELQKTSKNGDGYSDSKSNLKVNTDSSGGTSPFVFSPICELSPDIGELNTLPPFEPMPVPQLDISQLTQFHLPEINEKFLRRN